MPWHAHLQLSYTLEQGRTVARYEHSGPLRILQSLYPEGDAVCHNVLVHPPGGLVGGDTLSMDVRVAPGAHALVTTPGATRFYRSEGEAATQDVQVQVADGARLEWLPLEAIAYPQCQAVNRAVFDLAPGAELLAWDVTALGLPHAGQAFDAPGLSGCWSQHLAIPGVWMDQGRIRSDDRLLLDSPVGLAGQRCLATLVFAAGRPLARDRLEQALDTARALTENFEGGLAGCTAAHPQVLVLRALAPQVEPAMQVLRRVYLAWRAELWGLNGEPPRIWAM